MTVRTSDRGDGEVSGPSAPLSKLHHANQVQDQHLKSRDSFWPIPKAGFSTFLARRSPRNGAVGGLGLGGGVEQLSLEQIAEPSLVSVGKPAESLGRDKKLLDACEKPQPLSSICFAQAST